MTLVDDAYRAVEQAQTKFARQQAELDESLKLTLKARMFENFALRVELDEIDENLAVEIDGLTFTVIPGEPLMRSGLGLVSGCTDCGQGLIVPVASIVELGMILRGRDEGLLFCEECSLRHQPDYDPPADDTKPQTSLERFVDALQDVLVDYSLGGESLLAALRSLRAEVPRAEAPRKDPHADSPS